MSRSSAENPAVRIIQIIFCALADLNSVKDGLQNELHG